MYNETKKMYSEIGIDTEAVIDALDKIPISVQCWQGDDVRGFEKIFGSGGGIQVTGNHPGRARNAEELRDMLDAAFALIPGAKKVNLHAMYGDVENVKRDEMEPCHFKDWVSFARERKIGLDFNPTMFAHPHASDGLTLSHPDSGIRNFWIEHVKRCREIAAYFGLTLGQLSIMNLWIPDGYKDTPADQLTPRQRLEASLNEIFKESYKSDAIIDSLESKLFGIGLEGYTVGSHEFYMGYAVKNNLALCLDSGHFHQTELVSAKLSAISLFVSNIVLHVSRPMRWDSDHVVLLDDETISIAKEIVRHGLLDRVHIGLDYFDGSIDRVTAWAIGARNMRKALLIALLEPYQALQEAEREFDFTKRLLVMEEIKTLPWQSVWDEYCERKEVPGRILKCK
ncbi:MAG: L-rhamnose isomerase [Defluviitaleaceae bacterium]|nr:L-rhamnose isomerase [Defluviitaleaceae bacterium]